MQDLLIFTTNDFIQDYVVKNLISNRSFLYNQVRNILYIKYDDKLRSFISSVDEVNLVKTMIKNIDYISLADNVQSHSTDVCPDDKVHIINKLFLENATHPDKSILLIMPIDSKSKSICGEIFRCGEDITESYHISISNKEKNNNFIAGSSGNSINATIIKVNYENQDYYALKFSDSKTANLHFHGYLDYDFSSVPNQTVDVYLNILGE